MTGHWGRSLGGDRHSPFFIVLSHHILSSTRKKNKEPMLGTVTIMYMYNVDTYLFDLCFMPYSRMFSLTSIQRPAVL